MTIECVDGNTEVVQFEATLPSDTNDLKLTLIKKSEGEAWVDIGVTGTMYIRAGRVYKDLKVIDEGKNENLFNLNRVPTCYRDLDFNIDIDFYKSSYQLID